MAVSDNSEITTAIFSAPTDLTLTFTRDSSTPNHLFLVATVDEVDGEPVEFSTDEALSVPAPAGTTFTSMTFTTWEYTALNEMVKFNYGGQIKERYIGLVTTV